MRACTTIPAGEPTRGLNRATPRLHWRPPAGPLPRPIEAFRFAICDGSFYVDLPRSTTGDGCCASGPHVASEICPRGPRGGRRGQEALRHPYMQHVQRVSALTGEARDDPVGGAVRHALERPSTPPNQVRGSGRGEKGPAWGLQTLQSRSRPGYRRISFEIERAPSFCGDRARGAS